MRLVGLDIARFLAFAGMVLVNFRIAAQVPDSSDWTASFTHLLEGRAAALFVVLAGVGVSLAHLDKALMAKRALFLLAVGLLNQTIFEADILHYYGVYFLCAIPMMHASGRALLFGAWAVLAVSLILLIGLDYEAGWNWETLQYEGFWTPAGFLRNLFYNGWHPVFPWLSFLLFGMWLGQLDLGRQSIQVRMIIAGTIWIALIVGLSAVFSKDPDLAEITGLAPIPPGPLYVLAGIGTSTLVVGLCLLATPAFDRLGLTHWLAAPGRQTLTLYVAHILIGMGSLEALGWLDGRLSSPWIFGIALGFVLLSILYAKLWSLLWRRGPLEGLMRLITERRV
ncbi:MAG TPA: DUF418 domain-containing protein [Rhodobacteraceae bacterium]|nr:DUF418 domain-containing protein [Paracoccaceae bacterium]